MGNPVRIPSRAAIAATPAIPTTSEDDDIMSLVINDTAPAADGPYLYEEDRNDGDNTFAFIERWM